MQNFSFRLQETLNHLDRQWKAKLRFSNSNCFISYRISQQILFSIVA